MPKGLSTRAAFAARLKDVREAAGMTQTELAAKMGDGPASHQTNLSLWERGFPPESLDAEVVFGLEAAIGCAPGALSTSLGYEPSGTPSTVAAPLLLDEALLPEQRKLIRNLYDQLTS